ncbi:hypothetical protein TRFO_26253 [Tritrichomonas foetus]|uniref:AMP-dependent synthetase/ligase domain-containing protein n=1 Tax=Tritrichomonas foetus TaxID=1144522 RepID=A0A1J4K8Y2_9EUKA|nr:hypothetical protein TRFO_26253 [Tritrichomonas foetus]|eukprot:OHT05893.1 hypothetical protein TRFO_26253 [Tritrichomonas foetus]
MGTNYSQPPRGYQYSTQQFDNETSIIEVEPDFKSFYQLYNNNYQNMKNLPYLLRSINGELITYSYEKCFKICQSIHSFLCSHQMKPNSTIAVYSKSSFESQIICDVALLFGHHLLLSSPTSQAPDKFAQSIRNFSPFAVFCSTENAYHISKFVSNIQFITDTDSKFNSFHKISEFSTKYSTPEAKTTNEPCITFLASPTNTNSENVTISSYDMLTFLSSWSEKLKLCRDATIAVLLPSDDNVARLVNMLCIYNHSKLCFPNSLDSVKEFNPTHIFLSEDIVNKETSEINKQIADSSFFTRSYYNLHYFWKNTWVSWGSAAPNSDKKIFIKYQKDLGQDFHFAFCTGNLPKDVHENWIVRYGKPLSTVFIPSKWGNVGASLPCDVRFIKYGTLGGPVENSISIDNENGQIFSRLNGQRICKCGFWDEEGSLVIDSK